VLLCKNTKDINRPAVEQFSPIIKMRLPAYRRIACGVYRWDNFF